MKKLVISAWIVISATLLMAGGKVSPVLSPVADIPAKPCKADKVYIEQETDLMWQDQGYTDEEDGAYKRERSAGKAGRWAHAEKYCRSLDYSGYADWRLPTSDELQNMHRIPGQEFVYFRSRDFWTSTPASKGKYYVVYPADAYRYEHKTKRSNYVRCVRCMDKGDTKTGPAVIE